MGLFDRFRKDKPQTNPAGGSGRSHIGGFLELEELNLELQGARGQEIFDAMYRTDPDVRRSTAMVANPLVAGTWTVEPFGGDNADDDAKKDAELIEWALFERMRPTWPNHLAEAVPLAIRAGYGPFELTWEASEWTGQQVLVPKKVDVRLPRSIRRWIQDDDGDLKQIEQFLLGKGMVLIDATELVYYRVGAEGDNWEGVSLLRPAYKPWFLKDKIERLDAIAIDREATGIPVVYPPRGDINQDVLDELLDTVSKLKAGEEVAVVMPGPKAEHMTDGEQGWTLEVIGLSGDGGSGSRSVIDSLRHHQDGIAAAVIAEFMRLGQKTTGARATADLQQDPFYHGVQAIAKVIETPWNDEVIPRIIAYNSPNAKGVPTLKMEEADGRSITELQTFVSGLISSGALVADHPLEDWLRDFAGLPPADPEERDLRDKQREEDRTLAVDQAKAAAENPAGAGASPGNTPGAQPAGKAGKPKAKPDAPGKKAAGVVGEIEEIADELRAFNWIEEQGGLPPKIRELSHKVKGKDESSSIAIAVSQAKKLCAKGDEPEWCAAVSEWEAKRAAAHAHHDVEIFEDRPLTWWEQGMALDVIESAIGSARDDFRHVLGDLVREVAVEIARNPAGADAAESPKLTAAFEAELMRLYELGRLTVADELDRQDPTKAYSAESLSDALTAADTGAEQPPEEIRRRASAAVAGLVARVFAAVARLGSGQRRTDAEVQAAAEAEGEAALKAEADVHASSALQLGRADEADSQSERIRGSRYTSILDDNRCDPCKAADDDVLRPLDDPVRLARKPPNPECQGGDRCRCLEFFELKSETPASFAEGPDDFAIAFSRNFLRWPRGGKWSPSGPGPGRFRSGPGDATPGKGSSGTKRDKHSPEGLKRTPAESDVEIRSELRGRLEANPPSKVIRDELVLGPTHRSRDKILGGHATTLEKHGQRDENGELRRDANGHVIVSPARKRLHRKILRDFLSGKLPADRTTAKPERQEHPQLLAMAGGPGSGKSSILRQNPALEPHGSVLINPDEIRIALPEYGKMVEAEDPFAAGAAHEEASQLAKMLTEAVAANRFNATLDVVGDSEEGKYLRKLGVFHRNGYEVNVNYVTAPVSKAQANAIKRQKRTGRRVDPERLRKDHAAVSKRFPAVRAAPFVHSLKVWDNGVPQGEPAKLIYERTGARERVIDEEAMQRFLAKGEGGNG